MKIVSMALHKCAKYGSLGRKFIQVEAYGLWLKARGSKLIAIYKGAFI